jgi:hypothetical protein
MCIRATLNAFARFLPVPRAAKTSLPLGRATLTIPEEFRKIDAKPLASKALFTEFSVHNDFAIGCSETKG